MKIMPRHANTVLILVTGDFQNNPLFDRAQKLPLLEYI
jgi:hypothetical protein